jgi:hypothetical protein
MAFVYHNISGMTKNPFIVTGNSKYSKQTIGDDVIDLIKEMKAEHGVTTVDYLTCDLNDDVFKSEVAELETELEVDIRYSVD